MADTQLRPSSTIASTEAEDESAGTTNLHDALNEGTPSDSTYTHTQHNSIDAYCELGLDDLPADAVTDQPVTAITCTIRTRHFLTRDNDDITLDAQILTSGDTALTDSFQVDIYNSGGAGSWTDRTPTITLTAYATDTATESDWNGAKIRFDWTYAKTQKGDPVDIDISNCELDVTYTTGPISAVGVITFSGTLAPDAKGTSLAFGTITITGDLDAAGTGMIYAAGTSTITGDLDASQHSNIFGVTTFIGELIAGGGVSFGFATSTFSASLAAIGTKIIPFEEASSGLSIGSAQHRFYEVTLQPVFGLAVETAVGITTASGTITITGEVAASGTHLAGGTSTFSGQLAAVGQSLQSAVGTIAATGDLAAVGTTNTAGTITVLGQGLSEATHLAAGTIAIAGDLAAVGQSLYPALGTITATGDLVSRGTSNAFGTITVTGDLVAENGVSFAFATSTFIGDLAAIGTNLGGAVTALGTITATGDLVATGTTNVAATITVLGQGLSEGIHLAAGTITITGNLAAIGRPKPETSLSTVDVDRTTFGAPGNDCWAGLWIQTGGNEWSTTDGSNAYTTSRGAWLDIGFSEDVWIERIINSGSLNNQDPGAGRLQMNASREYKNKATEGGTNPANANVTFNVYNAASGGDLIDSITIDINANADLAIKSVTGTITITGSLSGIGSGGGAVFSEASSGLAFSSAQHLFYKVDQQTINVGATKLPSTGNRGSINVTGTLRAVSYSGDKYPTATIHVFGETIASSGLVQVSGTITVIGDLSARLGTVIGELSATTIFTDELPIDPPYVWLRQGTPPADIAKGSIEISADLSVGDDLTQFAFGTVSFLGAVQVSTIKRAFGTITATGDLVAVGAKGVVSISGTITVFGSVDSVSANVQGSGSIAIAASLTALGTNPSATVVATGTITFDVTLFGAGHSFCPITASGSIAIAGDLVAREEPTDDVVTASAGGVNRTLANYNSRKPIYSSVTPFPLSQSQNLRWRKPGIVVGRRKYFGPFISIWKASDDPAGLTGAGHGSNNEDLWYWRNDNGSLSEGYEPFVSVSGDEAANGHYFIRNITQKYPPMLIQYNYDGDVYVVGQYWTDENAEWGDRLTKLLRWQQGDDWEVLWRDFIPALRAKGTIIGDGAGTFFAYATIKVIGDLPEAEIRKVSCIRPTGTIRMSGATMSAFGGDLNQKYAFATITVSSDITVISTVFRSGAISVSGSLTANGRLLMDGSMNAVAQPSIFSTLGQVGPGTIDGQKKAIIRTAFGSIELYNNSQGGFYSIGSAGLAKEAFALINFAVNLAAKGSRDQTKFGRGTITITGIDSQNLAAIGNHTGVTATATATVDITADGRNLAAGTLIFIGDLAVVGTTPFAPTYNGAQSPTIVAITASRWGTLTFPGSDSRAECQQDIYIQTNPILNQCFMYAVGAVDGHDDDEGSIIYPFTEIFRLNELPDTVRIRLVEAPFIDSDHGTYPSTTAQIGTFTDDADFVPASGFNYGYRANCDVSAQHDVPPGQNDGQITPIVEFTFKKAGFYDLVLLYKIEAQASAQAEEDEEPEQ